MDNIFQGLFIRQPIPVLGIDWFPLSLLGTLLYLSYMVFIFLMRLLASQSKSTGSSRLGLGINDSPLDKMHNSYWDTR